jgi:hypothetical protein
MAKSLEETGGGLEVGVTEGSTAVAVKLFLSSAAP